MAKRRKQYANLIVRWSSCAPEVQTPMNLPNVALDGDDATFYDWDNPANALSFALVFDLAEHLGVTLTTTPESTIYDLLDQLPAPAFSEFDRAAPVR